MSEWLISRALRYQWLTALVVFCIVFSAMQPLHGRYETWSSRRTNDNDPVTLAGVTSGARTQVIAAATSSPQDLDEPSVKSLPPLADDRVQRLLIQQRVLDSRISAARRMLLAPAPDAAQLVQAPPATAKVPIMRVVSRPEETTLHREIAAQRSALEALRLTDTDAHPDVIAARERLDTLQDRLSAYLALHGPAQTVQIAADITPEIVETAGVLSARPVYRDSMPQLARLIETRASLERQILSLTSAKKHAVQVSVQPVALLDATPRPVPAVQHLPVHRGHPAIFQALCCAAALSSAVTLAAVREYYEGHLAGPSTLERQLPASTYFHFIPRMKA